MYETSSLVFAECTRNLWNSIHSCWGPHVENLTGYVEVEYTIRYLNVNSKRLFALIALRRADEFKLDKFDDCAIEMLFFANMNTTTRSI